MSPRVKAAPAKAAPAKAVAAPAPRRRTRLTRSDRAERRFPVIYRRLEKEYPDAKTALNFTTPYEMLFATIMSAQSTDVGVNKVTGKLFRKYATLEDYANADTAELENDIHATGFFRMKAKAIQGSARKILDDYGGELPRTMAEMLTLPGVARKTANVVLNNAYGLVEGIAVDTHVGRLARKLGLTAETDPVKVEKDLMALIPRKNWMRITYLFIDHGRKVCKAPTPRCEECVLSDICPSSLV
ncbi:MAG TPA: endonuclease III [Actinomycetota bacterium]|nr:endonuclease III [Actinomycetota bacterium]